MKKGDRKITSVAALEVLFHELSGHDFKKPLVLSWKLFSKKRSLSMNALSHVWYGEISKANGEPEEAVKRECKLLFGVPILLAEDNNFFVKWASIDFVFIANRLQISPHEAQLEMMREIPVTSRMVDSQMYRYLTHMQHAYAEQGIVLESTGQFIEMREQQAQEMLRRVA